MSDLQLEHSSVKSALRIMDVASELRRQRERAEGQLNIDEVKSEIREKIKATAEVTGEELSAEEINTAIESYFSGLYRFKPPRKSLQYYAARLYIARGKITKYVVAPILLLLGIDTGLDIQQQRAEQHQIAAFEEELRALPAEGRKLYQSAATLARSEKAKSSAASRLAALQAAEAEKSIEKLQVAVAELRQLNRLLREQYTVKISNSPNQKSGIDRYYTDERGRRVSGYYLIVSAFDKNGHPITRRIRSKESGAEGEVQYWGERVPKAVYEQVRRDKLDNGIVDNDLFAEKHQGDLEMQVAFSGPDGAPLQREAQITSW